MSDNIAEILELAQKWADDLASAVPPPSLDSRASNWTKYRFRCRAVNRVLKLAT